MWQIQFCFLELSGLFSFSLFGHARGMQKFPRQGLNSQHSYNQSHSSDNTGSLTAEPRGNAWIFFLIFFIQGWLNLWMQNLKIQRANCICLPKNTSNPVKNLLYIPQDKITTPASLCRSNSYLNLKTTIKSFLFYQIHSPPQP